MNKYIDYILNFLIEKYENSKLSQTGSKLNLKITMKFDNKNFQEYVSEDSYQYEEVIEEAVSFLERKNFIDVIRFNGRIDRVVLNIDLLKEVYKYLGKNSRLEKEKGYRTLFKKYEMSNLVMSFYQLINEKFLNFKSYKSYFNSKEELEEILVILSSLENQTTEISKRVFSSKYLGNSKRFEHIEAKIIKIIKEILNISDLDNDSILLKFNIVKNPTFIYIKGKGKFRINTVEIDLEKLDSELILSSNHLKKLEILSLNVEKIITIENLTTFYDYKDLSSLIIYLGGFHNQIRKEFLLKLKKYKNNLKFYHLGDIDAGGFYILNHLINDTGIKFQTIRMDIATLKQYKNYGDTLTIEDKKRLNDLKNIANLKDYQEVINYMLEENIKLEQENIDYNYKNP